MFGCCWCLDNQPGQGGGRGSGEEDAAARERVGPDSGQLGASNPQSGGEGKGFAERESPPHDDVIGVCMKLLLALLVCFITQNRFRSYSCVTYNFTLVLL